MGIGTDIVSVLSGADGDVVGQIRWHAYFMAGELDGG